MAFPVDNIRRICAIRNTTLAEVERALNIGNGVIARWEFSKKSPPYDRLLAIAEYLGTTVEILSAPDIPAVELAVSVLNAETKKTAAPKDDGLTAAQRKLLELIPLLSDSDVSVISATAQSLIASRKSQDAE